MGLCNCPISFVHVGRGEDRILDAEDAVSRDIQGIHLWGVTRYTERNCDEHSRRVRACSYLSIHI